MLQRAIGQRESFSFFWGWASRLRTATTEGVLEAFTSGDGATAAQTNLTLYFSLPSTLSIETTLFSMHTYLFIQLAQVSFTQQK